VIVLVTLIALIIVATAVVVVVSLVDDGTIGAAPGGGSSSPAGGAPPANQPAGMPCDLKIAFMGTANGDFATEGISESDGLQLALAEYNATYPKCPVTAATFDTNPNDEAAPGDATMAAAAQRAVADQRVIGVVGPVTSSEATPAYPVLQNAGLPGITPSSTNDDLTTHGWTVFHRATGPRSTLFYSMTSWLAAQHKKVYVVDDGSLYGKQLTQLAVQVLGAGVIRTERVNGSGSYPGTATRVRNAAPGIVVYGGYGITGGKLLTQLRAKGVTADFVVGDLTDQPPFEDYGGASTGTATVFCMCRVPAGETGSAEKAFAAAYRKKFGEAPGIFADIAYDSTKMLLAGIMAGNFTRAALNTWVGTHTYAGVAGSYRFDAAGDLSSDQVVVTRHPAGQTAAQVVPTVHR
jgi:branched-chain amino acid transport system substrate-binding protein